ncbi:Bro-N domain-containing protein [Terasakiella pusilla]|uniref:BRO-N domain-containing protein n=1 Tax=Terasakiella pusilla TaxID=64973 RepID=UPI003AA7FFF4
MTIGNDPWFVAADIARVLALPNITSTLKSKYIDPNEKAMTIIGFREVNIISESGLYKLVMRSDKPQAKAFQDWVTRDVLPAIRKDGKCTIRSNSHRTYRNPQR